jgi:hypothetical protein
MWQKLIYYIFVFPSLKFSNFYVFLFLELFLHEPAMLLRYSDMHDLHKAIFVHVYSTPSYSFLTESL